MAVSMAIEALLHPFSYPSGRPQPQAEAASQRLSNTPVTDVTSSVIPLKITSADAAIGCDKDAVEYDAGPESPSDAHLATSLGSLSVGESDHSESSNPSTPQLSQTGGHDEGDDEDTTKKPVLPVLPANGPKIILRELILRTRKCSPNPEHTCDYFIVTRSTIAGWGAFAARDLYRGEIIFCEEYIIAAKSEKHLFDEYNQLSKDDKEIALSLHVNELLKSGIPRIKAVWDTNCFAIRGAEAGLFPISARFNHACHPSQNVDYVWDEERGGLTLTVRVDHIPKGAELTISYGTDRTPAELYLWYGFRCRCGACSGLSDEALHRLTSPW